MHRHHRLIALTALALAVGLAPVGSTPEALAGRAGRVLRVPKPPRASSGQATTNGQPARVAPPRPGGAATNHFLRRSAGAEAGPTRPAAAAAIRGNAGQQAAPARTVRPQRAPRAATRAPNRAAALDRTAATQRALTAGAQAQRQVLQREASLFQRARARTFQLRSMAIAVVTGIGGAFLSKFAALFGAASSGPGFQEFGSLINSAGFGNPIAEFVTPEVAIGFAVGAGITVAVGAIRAAMLRREARAIERGDQGALEKAVGAMSQPSRGQMNPYLASETLPNTIWPFQQQ